MTTDSRKIQLETEVVDGSKAGFDSMKRNAADAADAVQESAAKASKAVNGIGDGAGKAAEKLDQATRSMAASVQRSTALQQAGAKGTADFYEALAKLRGVSSEALKPYLEQLRQAERAQQLAQGSLNNMGVSAKQTAAALRGVPAQFTDIVTSLQGGQAPLTVLLQQGGQLKDMFGGAGNAAKALGGYVLGLVNPYTIAAAAVGGLAFAYFKGSSEASEFQKRIILSGNAAGVTGGQLAAMAAGISSVVGTKGAAADVLAQLVGTGEIARNQLQAAGQAIVAMSHASGIAVKAMVKDFDALGKTPAESILRLNEEYHFLTAATYEQIKALEKQGRSEDAAALAQRTYSDMLGDRAKAIKDQLGTLERAWAGVAGAAKSAWDSILDVGRESNSIDAKIARARQALIYARRGGDDTETLPQVRGGGRTVSKRAQLEEELAGLLALKAAEEGRAKTQGEQRRIQEASLAVQKAVETAQLGGLSKQQQLNIALEEYRRNIEKIRAADPASALVQPSNVKAGENSIRERFVDRAAAKDLKDANRELEKYRALLDSLAGKEDGFEADFTEKVALLKRGAKGDDAVYNLNMELLLKQQPFALKAVKEQTEAERVWAEARKKRYGEIQSQADAEAKAAEQSAKSVQDRVQGMQDEEAAMQRARLLNISLAQALEDVAIVRLNAAIADEQAKPDGSQERIDALQKEIEARRQLAGLNERKKSRDESGKAYDDIMNSKIGSDYAAGFDKASASMGTFVDTLNNVIEAQKKYNKARNDQGKSAQQIAELDAKFARDQISSYASLTGAAKGFFKEKTGAYKALEAAEQGLRVAQIAATVQSVASSFTEGTAKAAVGVANQAGGDPYSAFPRMAAMAAVMASLGFAVAGSFGGKGSGIDAAKIQAAQGTGTVFGDASAKSESLKNSLEHLEDIASPQLKYTLQMVGYLRSIDSSLQGVSGQILRTGGALTGAGFVGTTSQNMASLIRAQASDVGVLLQGGIFGLAVDKLTGGLLGSLSSKILGGIFGSSKTKLADSGLQFDAESLASILGTGVDAFGYQTTETTKKKLFGLSKSTSTATSYSPVDAAISGQFTQLVKDIYGSVEAASLALGYSADTIKAKLLGVTVDLGKISLKDLSGTQIQEQLTAVFGAFGDRLASAADSSVTEFQKVGEGYFETLVRVASGLEEGQSALRRMGIAAVGLSEVLNKQGDVATEVVRQSILVAEGLGGVADIIKGLGGSASDLSDTYKSLTDVRTSLRLMGFDAAAVGSSLIDGAGGLEELTSAVGSFREGFLTESEQIAVRAGAMAVEFQRLGIAMPASGEAYASLVKGIDTSTDAGKQLLGSILGLSGGFSDLLSAIKEVGSGIQDEITRIQGLTRAASGGTLAELQTSFAINSAQARAGDQAAIDLLPQISQALLKAAEATAGSSLDVAVIQAQTLASLQATLAVISDPTKRLQGLPGFASGGTFAGGLRIVGESGPELEATGPARIYSASDTTRMLASAGSGADVVQEIRALRAEVSALRGEQQIQAAAIAANTGKAARILESVTPEGNSISTVAST